MSLFYAFFIHVIAARDWNVEWKQFKLQFNKTYDSHSEEYQRFQIFMENIMILESWNNEHGNQPVFGTTKYADLTYAEFSNAMLGYSNGNLFGLPQWDSMCYSCARYPEHKNTIPKSLDWIDFGALNPPRNQARCGSCWAFSTICGAESAIFIGSGELPQLSEEELVQCAHSAGHGCKGGEMQAAYDWILHSEDGWINNEIDYPYTSGNGKTGKCQKEMLELSQRTRISGAVSINYFEEQNEDRMVEAVARIGPLSVGINARYLHHYKGGIIDPEVCTPSLNHGVVIVGYGIDNNKSYWKVRNSWGSSWGEEGYFRLKRGELKCGIAQDVSAAYFIDTQPPNNGTLPKKI